MKRWTAADLPDLTGRTALVTGANSGIGLHTALELARCGAHVVLAGRDPDKGKVATAWVAAETGSSAVEWALLDLADLASVRRFVVNFSDAHDGLDLLVNNAGVMALPRQPTADGFERQFGVNHLGHFALTGLLLPALLTRPGARVVTVTSGLHRSGRIDFDDLMGERSYGQLRAYSQSKLANLLFTLELDRRAAAASACLVSVAAHPGVAHTNLASTGNPVRAMVIRLARMTAQSAAAGALPSLYAATASDVVGGETFAPDGVGERKGFPTRVRPAEQARDLGTARRLWEKSEQLTGVRFSAFDREDERTGLSTE